MLVVPSSVYRSKWQGNVVISESGQRELPEEWDYEPEVKPSDWNDEEIAANQKILIDVPPSQFVEFSVKVADKATQKLTNFSFANRRYLKLPYDTPSKRVLFKCGRQVEKSTTLGNKCLAYACLNNNFNILYVSPTNQQSKVFSQDRLKEPIETSEILRAWTTTQLSDNVFHKQFINRSQIKLRYAYHNADRTRGIPADLVLIDEIQDIITDNIPVIEQCASHSPFRMFLYSGTPKSTDNPIEKYWTDYSTQNEWVVPCDRHGVPGDMSTWHWNVLGERNLGKEGLVCDKCGNLIHALRPESQWAALNPGVIKRLSEPFEGFRIPQLMVPWLKWSEILHSYETSSTAVFNNEVLGLSYDTGLRPLTKQDVIDNCTPGILKTESCLTGIKKALGQVSPVYAGIDWGTGEGSYTVISLGAYMNGFFTIFFCHRFEGQELEPPVQLDLIKQLIKHWDVKLIGCDYGGGFDRNDDLTRSIGKNKIWKYQYSQPGTKVKWDPELSRFLVHRTEVMSDVFNAIKRKDVLRFMDWAHFENPFGKDMLNIFSEYNEHTRQIEYKHSPDCTDDAFHSILLCFLVSMMRHPRLDVLRPDARTGVHSDD
jgi:Phage terminase large subunit (GpA)